MPFNKQTLQFITKNSNQSYTIQRYQQISYRILKNYKTNMVRQKLLFILKCEIITSSPNNIRIRFYGMRSIYVIKIYQKSHNINIQSYLLVKNIASVDHP